MTIILINNVEFKTIFVKKFKKLYFTDFFLKSASPSAGSFFYRGIRENFSALYAGPGTFLTHL